MSESLAETPAPRYDWTQPICERCWIDRETSEDQTGNLQIRRPVLLTEPEIHVCSFCGQITIFGCFVRADPKTLAYPRLKTDD